MKENTLKHSITTRYGSIMAVIIALSMTGMLSSALIAESLNKGSERISLAGDLRIQAYKIALSMQSSDEGANADKQRQVSAFQEKLYSPKLEVLRHHSNTHPLYIASQKIDLRWEQLRPRMEQTVTKSEALLTLRDIDQLADAIDNLVAALHTESDSKIRLLRTLQGVVLFATVISVFIALYNLSTHVVDPLRSMVDVAKNIQKGQFDKRIYYNSNDELGLLGNSINEMAESLSSLYGNLEANVSEKTQYLENSNRSLALLYQASLSLSEDARNGEKIQRILRRMESTLGNTKLSICMTNKESLKALQILPQAKTLHEVDCPISGCSQCEFRTGARKRSTQAFNISKGNSEFGELFAEFPENSPLKAWQINICHNIAQTLATSFSLAQKADQEHHMALMEERAVIARELHDSLAQSLSYLKMQTSRLEKLKQKGSSEELQLASIYDIRDGLNDAYRQLRELLTTFRLQIKEPGLKSALQGTVAEFSEKAQIPISLNFLLEHVPLTANEEIHTLQIVREALSNISRHAKASAASVEIKQAADSNIFISVKDNGIGLTEPSESTHYGTLIMQERASTLGGKLTLYNNLPHGVGVELTFTPSFLGRNNTVPQVENYEPLRSINNPFD